MKELPSKSPPYVKIVSGKKIVKHIKELNRSKSKISSREYKVSVIQMVEQKLYGDAKSVICVKNKRRNAEQVAKSKMNAWPNRCWKWQDA